MKTKTIKLIVALLIISGIVLITAVPLVVKGLFERGATATFPLEPCEASDSIEVENAKTTGVANSSVWDVSGAGHPDIQGFATDISVNKGEPVYFKIKTNATDYRLDIYRMGYYGGNGARKWDTIQVSLQQAQSQPACQIDGETGLLDCGNWSQSASWNVPEDAVSGIYFAKAVRNDNASVASHIVFIVRDDHCESDLLFQTSDTTWQAYNDYGDVTTPGSQNGKSLYGSASAASYETGQRAYKVSYNRPFNTGKPTPPRDTKHSWVFNAEYPMVRWLEANGYDVSYTTGVDSARQGDKIRAGHKVFLSVGHDEYWSGEQRANVEAARDAGVHLAFFSGNEIYWKTRWENNYRTLVCYKETMAGTENIDPDPTAWTGTWRDPRYSPPADGGRPENALIGAIFTAIKFSSHAIEVPADYRPLRLWRNVDFGQNPGPVTTLAPGTLAYEWGSDLDNGFRPPGVARFSSTTKNDVIWVSDHGSGEGYIENSTLTHNLTLYRHTSGALVFGASTVQWSWGLDNNHTYAGDFGNTVDNKMKQATVNLFADMGVQPASLQSPQTAASPSTDVTAPTSAIASPSPSANLEALSTVTISGTASDSGGLVAGVEVSVDNGVTWHPATGLTSWSYSWKPATVGAATIKSRAVDDSGRIETPSAGVTVNVAAPSCACGGCSNDAPSNKSLSLNGTSHYVRVPDSASINITGPLTVEAWIKTTASSTEQGIVERYDDEGGTDGGYALRLHSNGKLAFYTLRDRDYHYDFVQGSTTISTGVWHHVAGVFDGGQLRVYVDGVLDGTKASTFAPFTGTTDLLIGAKSPDASGKFQGLIDEVRLTAGALYATNFVPSTRLTATGNTKGLWRFESLAGSTVADASCNANDGSVVGGAGLSSDVGEPGIAGLKGHWRFDEGSSTTAADSSGTGNTGTLSSASWGAGKLNNAASFSGSNYVNMGASSSLEATNALTISAWIFPTGSGSDGTLGGVIVNKEGEYQLVRFPDGTIRWALNNSTPGWTFVNSGAVAPLNRWTHVALVYNNWSIQTYVNGVLVHTHAGAGAIADNVHPSDDDFRVGGRQAWSQFFQGRIDEVRFYNRGLSAADVQSLANEPVGYWKFDENTGSTTADSSGNAYNGTLTSGPSWTTGRVNSALSFDGTDDYVQVGAQAGLEMSDTLTISAWIFPTGAGSDGTLGGTIVNKEGEYQLFRLPNGSIRWVLANTDPGWALVDTGASAPLNQWTHVAFTYNKGTGKTYINGSLVHTYSGSGAIVDNIHPSEDDLRIGGRQGWNQFFNGKIDEVRVYNRGLSAAEVQILANELAGYWNFDENSGLVAADSSGNAFNGILLNGPAWTTGKTNSALTFDGTDDYVQVGAKPGLVMSDALTIAAWIFPTGSGSDGTLGGTIVNKEGEYQLFRLPNGSIRWVLANTDPGWTLVTTSGSAPLNQWTHVAFVYSNGTAKTYINGSLVDTRSASGIITDVHPEHNDFRIGGRQAWNQFFQGKIDEVRIYRVPLQAGDIATLAQ
ncbi:MAG TPA: LamG-like jellyroll fold domain-containing protein [Pyrinomonadaceae bacterium]|nr:LamG-like jellyroll fold domain-containing protein [Pyrinomonadaceae bacterium]